MFLSSIKLKHQASSSSIKHQASSIKLKLMHHCAPCVAYVAPVCLPLCGNLCLPKGLAPRRGITWNNLNTCIVYFVAMCLSPPIFYFCCEALNCRPPIKHVEYLCINRDLFYICKNKWTGQKKETQISGSDLLRFGYQLKAKSEPMAMTRTSASHWRAQARHINLCIY